MEQVRKSQNLTRSDSYMSLAFYLPKISYWATMPESQDIIESVLPGPGQKGHDKLGAKVAHVIICPTDVTFAPSMPGQA